MTASSPVALPNRELPGLIEPEALADWLAATAPVSPVRLLDATYHVPPSPRDARAEYQAKRLPGAGFFSIDDIAEPATDLPHMLPAPARFAEAVGALGIGNRHCVVVYDQHGLMSAARAWWTFRVFGHDQVLVLNGGLPRWEREGHPLESGPSPEVSPERFHASPRPELVKTRADLLANLTEPCFQVLDARPSARFGGQAPEPRPGLRGGHIPGSLNLPWAQVLNPAHQTMLPPAQLRARLEAAGVDWQRPMACTCGSGITACVNALALFTLGYEAVPVYDGSWAEWGRDFALPLSTGHA